MEITAKSKFAPRGGICEEVLEILVAEGASLREIAAELDRSVSTVRYWLKAYGFEPTGQGRRRKEAATARAAGIRRLTRECDRHGITEFVLEERGYYRCLKCRSEAVAQWRRNVKRRLVERAGGQCSICGYDGYQGALQFHHVDPTTKCFVVSRRGNTRSLAELQAEADKCILLCANCHAEGEAGARKLHEPQSVAPLK
jgi:transposase-like protein